MDRRLGIALAHVGCSAYNDVPRAQEVARQIEGQHPGILAVRTRVDILDDPSVVVRLVAGSTDVTARDVWCDVVLARGLADRMGMRVESHGSGDIVTWRRPRDCSDAADIPTARD